MRLRTWGGVLAALLVPAAAIAASGVSFSSADLNGRQIAIPSQLPAERTLLLVGFRHADQTALEDWRKGMGLTIPEADWLEMPVIGVGSPMIRGMILSAMKGGFPTAEERAHMTPTFADPASIARAFGVSKDEPAAIVIDRSGRVIARAAGAYDSAKAKPLIEALKESR